ncbi:MAG: FAD-binding oxidoreductase [Candidatus Dormiibacterota bacterium]
MRPGALAELAGVVGSDRVREGLPEDAPAGGSPPLVARPGSPEEVGEVLAWASSQGLAVVVRGGGTKPSWGAPARSCELILETLGLDRLLEHEPGDLTCVAEAGMRLDQLQDRVSSVAGHRQRLMLDPAQGGGATLGGLVATGASGPLRARYGTARELLLGARFALADGTVARTGGKVVKNVAGYDLDKLLVGSLGTLAVVLEVSLRLHPMPEGSRMVALEGISPEVAASFCSRVRRAPVAPTLLEALWPERTVLVRFDGSMAGALSQAGVVASLEPGARVLGEDEAGHFEERLRGRPWEGAGSVAGFGLPVSRTASLLELAEEGGLVRQLSLRAGLGVGEARLDEHPESLVRFRERVGALGGFVSAHRHQGPGAVGLDPLDPVAAELALAVKVALDPSGTLAPGRGPGGA